MDLSSPIRGVIPSLDAVVYAVLVRAQRPLTGRQVQRLATSGSPRGVQLILDRLVEHGVVDCQPAGTAKLYTLNREHVAAPAIGQLVELVAELWRRIAVDCSAWTTTPVNVTVFGSATRGDGDTASDIDMLIVRPDRVDPDLPPWASNLAALAESIGRWTGNPAALLDWTTRKLRRAYRDDEPIVTSILDDGITLYGDDIRALVQKQRAS